MLYPVVLYPCGLIQLLPNPCKFLFATGAAILPVFESKWSCLAFPNTIDQCHVLLSYDHSFVPPWEALILNHVYLEKLKLLWHFTIWHMYYFTPLCNTMCKPMLMLPLLEPLLICKWVLSSFSFYFWSVYCNYDIWVCSKLCAAIFNRLVSNELAAILSYFVIR